MKVKESLILHKNDKAKKLENVNRLLKGFYGKRKRELDTKTI